MKRIEYTPPVAAGLGCHNCLKPLVVTARILRSLELMGCNEYEYMHEDGTTECVLIREPRPYDAWSATRKVERALAERRRAEDRLLAEEGT